MYKTINSYLANPVAAASALGLTRVKQKEDDDTFHFKAAGVEAEFAYHKQGSPLDGGKLSLSLGEPAKLFPGLSGLLRTQLLKVNVSIDISSIRALLLHGYLKVKLGYELYDHHGNQKGLFTISREYDYENKKIPVRVEHTVGIQPLGGPQLIPNFLVTVDSDQHLTFLYGKFIGPDGVAHDLIGKLDLIKNHINLKIVYQNTKYTLTATTSKDRYPNLALSVSKGSTILFSIEALAQTPNADLVNYDLKFTLHCSLYTENYGCFEDKLKISWEIKEKFKKDRYGYRRYDLFEGNFKLHLLSHYIGDLMINTTAEFTSVGIRLATAIAVNGISKIDNVLVFQHDGPINYLYPVYFSMDTIVYEQYSGIRGIFHEINGNISISEYFPYNPRFQMAFDSSYNGHKGLMFSMDTLEFPYNYDLEIHDRWSDISGYFLYLSLPFSNRLKVTQKLVLDSELKTPNGVDFHLNVDDLLLHNISGIVNTDYENGVEVVLKYDWSLNDYSEGHVLQVVSKQSKTSEVGNFCLTTTFVSQRNGQLTEEYGLELYWVLPRYNMPMIISFGLAFSKKDRGNILIKKSFDVRGKQLNHFYGTQQQDFEIVFHQEKGETKMQVSVEYIDRRAPRVRLTLKTDFISPMMAIIEGRYENKQTGMAKFDFSVICFNPSTRFFDNKIEIMGSLEAMCTNNVKLLVKVNDHAILKYRINAQEAEIYDSYLLPVICQMAGLPLRESLKIKAVHESDVNDAEAGDNADMHLVYGPNKAGLQHGGNNLLVVGHAGHSAALGIFHISGQDCQIFLEISTPKKKLAPD